MALEMEAQYGPYYIEGMTGMIGPENDVEVLIHVAVILNCNDKPCDAARRRLLALQ